MIDMSLIERYTQCEQWVQNLSPGRYALLQGFLWFAMWTALEFVLGQQPVLEAVGIGLIGGVFYGWLCYSWGQPSS